MKKWIFVALGALAFQTLAAQTYLKLNALYAVLGIPNVAVETSISPHSTLSVEALYSPWKSFQYRGRSVHFNFGYLVGEYRYYFRPTGDGWYLGFNSGLYGFDISKPKFSGGHLSFKEGYSKGFGIATGLAAGYTHRFAERWVVDAYIGLDYMRSWYNGYFADGSINMHPLRPAGSEPANPDPFNGSSEVRPLRLGVAIGYRIIAPKAACKPR